jgi:hypothetical protein
MAKYRKKPVVIDAIQWTGDNYLEMRKFIKTDVVTFAHPCLYIQTLEGRMQAYKGDYIIRGVNGEYYPCKPDIFEKTYEKVED